MQSPSFGVALADRSPLLAVEADTARAPHTGCTCPEDGPACGGCDTSLAAASEEAVGSSYRLAGLECLALSRGQVLGSPVAAGEGGSCLVAVAVDTGSRSACSDRRVILGCHAALLTFANGAVCSSGLACRVVGYEIRGGLTSAHSKGWRRSL